MPTFEEFIGGEKNAKAFRKTAQVVDKRTMATLKAIFEMMPWGRVFDLPDGEQATIEKFVEPKIDEDGTQRFSFDVRDTLGGWHLEFMVHKTGWGGAPVSGMSIPDGAN